MNNLVVRVIVFIVLMLLCTIVLGGTQEALGITGGTLQIAQWGPACAALVMIFLMPKGWRQLTIAVRRSEWKTYLTAFGFPVVVSLCAGGVYTVVFANAESVGFALETLSVSSLPMILFGVFVGAFGEEIGWRGYLQKLLDSEQSKNVLSTPFGTSAIVGAVWGAWHVSNYQYGVVYMLCFIVLMVAISVVLRLLLLPGSDNYSVIGFSFHSGINIGLYLFVKVLPDTRIIAVSAVLWWAIVAVLFFLQRTTHKEKKGVQTGR